MRRFLRAIEDVKPGAGGGEAVSDGGEEELAGAIDDLLERPRPGECCLRLSRELLAAWPSALISSMDHERPSWLGDVMTAAGRFSDMRDPAFDQFGACPRRRPALTQSGRPS